MGFSEDVLLQSALALATETLIDQQRVQVEHHRAMTLPLQREYSVYVPQAQ